MRTAVVTGASRGLGKEIAKAFAKGGYYVAVISRNLLRSKAAVREMRMLGYENVAGYRCDVTDRDHVTDVLKDVKGRWGSIDVLVNNAGTNARKDLRGNELELSQEFGDRLRGWKEEIDTNLTGTYICSYAAAMHMANGCIINISSVKGIEATTSPGYGASKAGIIKLTKDLATALGPRIRVNCIAPGFIDTGMTSELSESKKSEYARRIPLRRFGEPKEIADIAVALASPAFSYVTGARIDVNGGYL